MFLQQQHTTSHSKTIKKISTQCQCQMNGFRKLFFPSFCCWKSYVAAESLNIVVVSHNIQVKVTFDMLFCWAFVCSFSYISLVSRCFFRLSTERLSWVCLESKVITNVAFDTEKCTCKDKYWLWDVVEEFTHSFQFFNIFSECL